MARKLIVEIIGDSSSLEKSFKQTSAGANKFEKDIGRTVRGSVAASGAFKSLGRSIAFASGGFLAGAGITAFLKSSIEQAQQAAVAQKQLSAQFRAAGQDLGRYQSQIDKSVASLSHLAGIEDDEVKASFTLAFRATQNVTQALRLTAIGADVARARHIQLAQAVLALNKAYGGNVGALRRLGITIPKSLTGMKALEFVARRFAGQARAGTTDQERFAAALTNTKQIIGTELLPVLDKLLRNFTKFLNNPKNQKKIQQDTKKTVSVVGEIAKGIAALGGETKKWVDKLHDAEKALKRINDAVSNRIFGGGLDPRLGIQPSSTQGQSTSDRRAGLSPGGPGSFAPTSASVAAAAAVAGRPGLHAQFVRSQLALAKAQTTATQADDRRVLEQQRKIILAAIKLTTNLKKRTSLYKQLADIQNQIAGIDQNAQDAADAHAQKLKDARQKALDAAKRRADAEKAQDAKELAALKAREDKLKTQIEAIQGRLKDQLDIARQGIGDLFAGPVKADASEIARRTLGLTTAPTGIGALTANLRAQTSQAAQFQKDINRLVKRGAPNELIKELRAAGVAGAGTQAHTLATATGPALKAFLTEFGKREKLALTTTQTIMRSQTVTLTADKVKLEGIKQEIHLHHTTELNGRKIAAETHKWQVRAQKRTAAQTSGRVAGFGPVVG